jgi:DNA polymerase/3'-5' exonuclease PolX
MSSAVRISRKAQAMTVHNREIAEQFSRLADLLEIEGADAYRVHAYRQAAQTIAGFRRASPTALRPTRT